MTCRKLCRFPQHQVEQENLYRAEEEILSRRLDAEMKSQRANIKSIPIFCSSNRLIYFSTKLHRNNTTLGSDMVYCVYVCVGVCVSY